MNDRYRNLSGTSLDHTSNPQDSTISAQWDDSIELVGAESKTQQVDEYPDGGPMAWLAVAGATACLFVSFGWVNVIGIFQEHYQSNQLRNYTPSDIAWIPSLQSK